MAQSDARFGYEAKLSREEHDLSRAFGFTTAPGMLNPIFADIATPGDTYYIHHDLDFLRTAPLLAPSMIDVKVHYETFFVPFQMIYEPVENTVFSLSNFRSSLYSDPALLNQSFPLFRLQYYVNSLYTQNAGSVLHQLAFRFADLMGCNPYAFTIDGFTPDSSGGFNFTGTSQLFYFPSFFPWKALAYHTIFQYYYRLDDKSQFNNVHANWDQFYATHYVDVTYNQGASQSSDNVGAIFTIYQRPWNFDYFSSIYRSPIVSDANLQSVLANSAYSPLSVGSTLPLLASRTASTTNSTTASFGSSAGSSPNSASIQGLGSTVLIRQAFANEKLAMITGRTRKNYDSQVLAHFGIKVPHDVKHDVTLVGRDTFNLRVGEVTSLATTQTGNTVNALGELAGKGWASGQGKEIKFTVPCHGVMMTIFSIEPMRRYGSAIERNSMIDNAFDLPIPEFDRLGNQPMYLYEQSVVDQNQSPNYGAVIGWKERYYWWKRSFDKVSLAFMPVVDNQGQSLPAVNNYLAYFLSYNPFGRKTTNNAYPSLERSFYIDRGCLNDQFAVPFVEAWQATESENWNKHPFKVYQRDPFIVNSNVKVKKVSWLSKDGEPVYPY